MFFCGNAASSTVFIKEVQHGFIGYVTEKQASSSSWRYLQQLALGKAALAEIATMLVERFLGSR